VRIGEFFCVDEVGFIDASVCGFRRFRREIPSPWQGQTKREAIYSTKVVENLCPKMYAKSNYKKDHQFHPMTRILTAVCDRDSFVLDRPWGAARFALLHPSITQCLPQ